MKTESFFVKGIFKDATSLMQPKDTYTDNTGFRLVSNGNNSYSLESARGNIVSFVLNPGYQPIGWDWLGDHISILSTNSVAGAVSNGEIGIATFGPLDKFPTPRYIPLYNHVDLDFSSYHQVECILNKENNSIERNYWTDFFNPPRTLNILNPVFTTYFATGTLVIGDQYMVVQGSVTHNAIDYGPNEAAGTVFTAVNVNYTDNAIPGFPGLVIGYENVALIDIVPKKDLGNILFSRWLSGGSVLSGGYQYAYRLQTSDGTFTNWSYLSQPVNMGDATIPAANVISYQQYQGEDSTATTVNSSKGIELEITGIDTNFANIQVAYVRSIALTSPLPPVIFYDGSITSADMIIAHMGNDDLEAITFADLEVQYVSVQKAKTLRSQKNRLFFGNIETGIKFDFDPSGATVEPFDYLVPSDVMGYPDATNSPLASDAQLNGHRPTGTGIPTGEIITSSWYQVFGTGTVTYNAVIYNVGDVFIGLNNIRTFTTTLTATVKAVIRVQKYTGVYEYHVMENDWYDQKGMTNDFYIRGYWRNQTYRMGVMLWDKYGNPTFVRWMKDVVIPEQWQTVAGINYRLLEMHFGDVYPNAYYSGMVSNPNTADIGTSLRHIGIKVSALDLKQIADSMGITVAELSDKFDGFSVVRAERDATILGQGILFPTGINGNDTHPMAANGNDGDAYINGTIGTGRRPQTYCWYSPDFQFRFNSLPNEVTNDHLQICDYLQDFQQGSVPDGTLETTNFHFYSKFYEQQYGPNGSAIPANVTPLGSQNEIITTSTFEIEAGATGNSYIGSLLFNNTGATNSPGGFGGTTRYAIGARTMLMYLANGEGAGDYTYGYGYNAAGETVKTLCNWIRPKSNLYGGSSDSAKAQTQYMYSGHYQKFDSTFMTYLVGNVGIVDDIEVWGGDCFVTIYDNARMVKDPSQANQMSNGTLFPVESNCNTFLRQGRHLSKDRSYEGGANGNGIDWPGQIENYIYNAAYSHQEGDILYPALPVDFLDNTQFEHRVIYSEIKTDGEATDNWRVFLPNSFRDLEGSNGEINNLRRKEGKLFCWQNRGVIYLPVLERVTTSSPLGEPVTLGTGGVLDRFDEIKNFYGNQHQWSLCESEDGFFWFDFRRRAFMYMVGGMTELQVVKGLHSFLANAFIDGSVSFDNPIDRGGITSVYDARFKEVIMAFRTGILDLSNLFDFAPNHLTMGFDTINKQFSVLNYPYRTGIMIGFNDRIFSGWPTRWSTIQNSTAYTVGNELNDGNSNYVCVLAYTSAPAAVIPSLDPTHWTRSNSINEIYVHNEGDYGKFYGVVYDYLVSFIINDNKEIPKYFELVQKLQNSTSWSTEIYQTSFQTAQDLALDVTASKDYKYRDRSWYSSVPKTSDRQRLVDHYMKVTLKKINSLNSSPLISKNELIQLVSVIVDYNKAF